MAQHFSISHTAFLSLRIKTATAEHIFHHNHPPTALPRGQLSSPENLKWVLHLHMSKCQLSRVTCNPVVVTLSVTPLHYGAMLCPAETLRVHRGFSKG